jgi:hypothetical protein
MTCMKSRDGQQATAQNVRPSSRAPHYPQRQQQWRHSSDHAIAIVLALPMMMSRREQAPWRQRWRVPQSISKQSTTMEIP